MKDSLLVEFLVEELPSSYNVYEKCIVPFVDCLLNKLKPFFLKSTTYKIIYTPRRFGVVLYDINDRSSVECPFAVETFLRKGPPLNIALADGEPTISLLKFMESNNVASVSNLIKKDGYFYAEEHRAIPILSMVLEEHIISAVKSISCRKPMSWGTGEYLFIRPVHNLLVMINDDCFRFTHNSIFALSPVPYTFGHRLLNNNKIYIDSAANYFKLMEEQAHVIADYDLRLQSIMQQVSSYEERSGLSSIASEDIYRELAFITEFPVIIESNFNYDFLSIPDDFLQIYLEKYHKFIPMANKNGDLQDNFLLVVDNKLEDYSHIALDNKWVIDSRLLDLQFFLKADIDKSINDYVQQLQLTSYYDNVGSQYDRVQRISSIIRVLQNIYQSKDLYNAAQYSKLDICFASVNECKELSGIAGKHYLLAHNIPFSVADTVAEHHYPRFAGDRLPKTDTACFLALADRLEYLFCMWFCGNKPTSERDSFGVRRTVVGIIRLLCHLDKYSINIKMIIHNSLQVVNSSAFSLEKEQIDNMTQEIYAFFIKRLIHYFRHEQVFTMNNIYAVCFVDCDPDFDTYHIESIAHIVPLLNFLATNQLNDLIAVNKRVLQLLKNGKKYDLLPHNDMFMEYHCVDEVFDNNHFNSLEKYLSVSVNMVVKPAVTNWAEFFGEYFSKLIKLASLTNRFLDKVVVYSGYDMKKNYTILYTTYRLMNYYLMLTHL